MPAATIILPEGDAQLALKEGDELDLRLVVKDNVLVVTKVLRHTKQEGKSADFKASLGQWNRK